MNLRIVSALLLGVALTASGCKCSKKEDAKKEKVTASAAKPKKSAKQAPKKPKVDVELVRLAQAVKTEEDFETKVEKDIVLDNLEEQVDKLDQELTPTEE